MTVRSETIKRVDFTAQVKAALAARAGYRCSFPNCDALTVGPSDESSVAIARTGMACHIYAAAGGPAARRVAADADRKTLGAVENGVWMCYTHGKLIDADECTYTPTMLAAWRTFSERRAAARQRFGDDVDLTRVDGLPVADMSLALTTPDLAGEIAQILFLSCISQAWGRVPSLAARDIAIELGRNALIHGGATVFNLEVSASGIRLTDDGAPFSHADLADCKTGRGGARAFNQTALPETGLIATYARINERNITTLLPVGSLAQALHDHPCSLAMTYGRDAAQETARFVEEHSECGTVFLRPYYGIIAHSDVYNIVHALKERGLEHRDVVLVVAEHSDDIHRLIAELMPSIRVIEQRECITVR